MSQAEGSCAMTLKYRATRYSVQPSDPPGCPLAAPWVIRMMSRRTWLQMRWRSSVEALEALAGAGFVMSIRGGVMRSRK